MADETRRAELHEIGQEHVLRFWDELDDAAKTRLAEQLRRLDLELIRELVEGAVHRKRGVPIPSAVEPVAAFPLEPSADQIDLYEKAARRGEELLRHGRVAAFLVAGGQGTRLGFDGPKGMFRVTPIRQKPLFQVFSEQLLARSRTAGRPIPWYVMTSEANDAETRELFAANAFFGYEADDIYFFEQGMLPAFSFDGRMLLAAKDSLALSPDGHGGSLRALERSGALADMRRRGIEHLSYFQVDNPLVHTIDPRFLGLHDLDR